MQIKKKTPENSARQLCERLLEFIEQLKMQDEKDAVEALRDIHLRLENIDPLDPNFQAVLKDLKQAFSSDGFELDAYMVKRQSKSSHWSEVDQLYLTSTGVWSLLNRLTR